MKYLLTNKAEFFLLGFVLLLWLFYLIYERFSTILEHIKLDLKVIFHHLPKVFKHFHTNLLSQCGWKVLIYFAYQTQFWVNLIVVLSQVAHFDLHLVLQMLQVFDIGLVTAGQSIQFLECIYILINIYFFVEPWIWRQGQELWWFREILTCVHLGLETWWMEHSILSFTHFCDLG